VWNVRYRYLSSIFYILTWYEPKYKPSRRLSFRHLPSYFSALDGNNFNWSAIIPDTNWTLNSSVRYLWHFVRIRMRMRILGSVPLTNASWCLSRMAKIRGSGTLIKSIIEGTKQNKSKFFLLVLFDYRWIRSRKKWFTCGSGKPKNIRIPRISFRVRIRSPKSVQKD